MQRTAKDSNDFDPEVTRSVEKNSYVDDYLKSVESHEKAIRLVDQLRNLLARGGFTLTKWVSNSRAVVKTILRQLHTSGVQDLDLGSEILPVERALGACLNVETQIHHFSDASEIGYGAVSYLRFIDADGKVHCSFIMSNTRLAPLKSLSVPRLELTAATLAVKLVKMLRKELEVSINGSVFWTDSTSVLRYIENKDKRFHMFVSNRLTMIDDGSTPDRWRYVDSKRNPSDAASRGLSAKALLEN